MTDLSQFQKARLRLLIEQPFYGMLAMRLLPVQDSTIDTACTNGKVIRYNPMWFMKLQPDQRKFVVAHEVAHVANRHHLRRGARDPKKWNIAADYVINGSLKTAGFDLTEGALVNPAYDGMSTEQVYNMLPDGSGGDGSGASQGGTSGNGPGQPSQDSGNDPGGSGGVEDDPKSGPEADAEVRAAIIQAVNASKSRGTVPGWAQRMFDEWTKPVHDWRATLRRTLSEALDRADYTWSRPNRRFIGSGLYLPSVRGTTAGTVVIGLDTSGSISSNELGQFEAEVNSVLADADPRNVIVLHCDSDVAAVEEFEPGSPVKLSPKGGGGTNFCPVFDWCERNGIVPDSLVYLTDMMGEFPDSMPDYPVIWAATTDIKAPWGETVRLQP